MVQDESAPVALPRWRAPLGERSDHYLQSLWRAGARVLYLQPSPEVDARRELANVAGLVLSGGVDIDPRLYGERPHSQTDRPHPFRDRYELALLKEAVRRDLPVLAICRGHQLLNVFMGGKLIQHIANNSHRAEPDPPRRSAWHDVTLAAESRLADTLGDGPVQVNSRHHQGVAPEIVASGLRVTGLSPDGLVEAMEGESQRWLVSVQWHSERPEMAQTMAPLFAVFWKACRQEGWEPLLSRGRGSRLSDGSGLRLLRQLSTERNAGELAPLDPLARFR